MKETVKTAFLATMLFAPGVQAATPEEAACLGGYRVMLMTASECRGYIEQLQRLQGEALDLLKKQHEEILRQRAASCGCAESDEAAPYDPPKLAYLEPGC